MRVIELISILKKFAPDAEVRVGVSWPDRVTEAHERVWVGNYGHGPQINAAMDFRGLSVYVGCVLQQSARDMPQRTIKLGHYDSAEDAAKVLSQLVLRVRTNYSNPPAHGAAIVSTILSDPELTAGWKDELAAMRNRINGMRDLFVKSLGEKGVERDFSFIRDQRGMFSFSGLNRKQVDALRSKYAIYIVGSGRINVAGMTEENMDRLCAAIAEVLVDPELI